CICLPAPALSEERHERAAHPPPKGRTGAYLAFQRVRFTRPNRYRQGPWALTPHFHHCPGGAVAVIFCGTVCTSRRNREAPSVRWYAALCCPDFPSRPEARR